VNTRNGAADGLEDREQEILKIAVCIKQVAMTGAPLQLDVSGRWLREADTAFEINAADNHALEAGLTIRDQHGGEVVVISLGPERAATALREALAKGADRAIHLYAEDAHALDPAQVAGALAGALRDECCDLILCGLQSDDHGYGQTGALLAHLMGWPLASIVSALEVSAPDRVRARRELEGGWYQWVELATPCVLTIQSGINKPRYAGMKGMLAAKKKPIAHVDLQSPAPLATRQIVDRIYSPQRSRSTCMIEAGPADAAAQLVSALNLRAVR
jgi:electron transfer flavoprotein beta subunit